MRYIDIVLDKLQTQKDILFPLKKLLCGKRRSFFIWVRGEQYEIEKSLQQSKWNCTGSG